jgi:hypothetical protein
MYKNISCIINSVIVCALWNVTCTAPIVPWFINYCYKFDFLPQCYFFSYCLFLWHFCFMCVNWQQTQFIHLFHISPFSVSSHVLYDMFPAYPHRGLTLILWHFAFGFMFIAFRILASIPQMCPHILLFLKRGNSQCLVWVVSCCITCVPCVMKIAWFKSWKEDTYTCRSMFS